MTRSMEDLLKELEELKKEAYIGNPEVAKKRKEQGMLSARERIEKLLDPGTFVELDPLVLARNTDFGLDKKRRHGDGLIAGYGKINGRLVFVYSQDFTFMGGSLGELHAKKIANLLDLAMKVGAPVVGLNDSGGARIQEGVDSLSGYGQIFFRNVLASGVIPQIAVIMGPSAGGAVYSPALMDFVIMVDKTSYMYITGPKVVKAVIGEDVDHQQLGGAHIHTQKSGVAHLRAKNDEEALQLVRKLLSYLPQNNMEDPPYEDTGDDPFRIDPELRNIVPMDPNKPYDMHEVITRIVDNGEFFEIQPEWAKSIIVGFARIGGHVVGIIANQPAHLAGVLDIDSSDKASRFIRFCDAFNIPILNLVDVPGFMPGTRQEHGGIIRHGAKMLYAYSEATVPKITVIIRKAYGGAYLAMCSKDLGADVVYAWPTAEIAVMGPEGAVDIIFRKELAKIEDPEEREKKRQEFIEEYRRMYSNPYRAAERGYIDDVIDPAETRPKVYLALEMLKTKREKRPAKKHGNMPV